MCESATINPKLCKDCKHCLKMYPDPQLDKPGWWTDHRHNPRKWKCNIDVVYDLVAGYTKKELCHTHRHSDDANFPGPLMYCCGKEGKFFEKADDHLT